MRTLFTFHGGIHPPQHKSESSEAPIRVAPLPAQLVLPLQQHLGAAAKPVVAAGQSVQKGQLLARADGAVSAAIHAPTSGLIRAIEPRVVPHPSGLPGACIVLEPDGRDQWAERQPLDYLNLPKVELLATLRDAGIVGLGGATFPTHVKFSASQPVQTLVLNGAECEPWITTDDRLMRERAAGIVAGIQVLRHLVAPAETLVGIEDNKPQAIAAMQQACAGTGIEVVAVPTRYPTGGEKQLIKILTGKEVPSGGRPLNVGVVCSNVATAYAVHRRVDLGEPMISRLVTVTGHVARPQNFEVLLGTQLADLVQLAGRLPVASGYILGGPMMGLPVDNDALPVVKATNCVIVKSVQLFPPAEAEMPCIRCTRCAQVCPAELQPQDLFWFARAKNFDKAEAFHLFDCIECGACAYVCPSHIPLVPYYRFAKSELLARNRERAAADAARERHEFRLQRIERDKQEKAAKLAEKERAAAQARQQAAEAVPVSADADGGDAAKIEAALARSREADRALATTQAAPVADTPTERG